MNARISILDRMHEAFNRRDFDVLAELLDEDVLLVADRVEVRGRAAVLRSMAEIVERTTLSLAFRVVDGRVLEIHSSLEPDARGADAAAEQAALRRVATLVAQGASRAAVFEAVVAETHQLLGEDVTALTRFEPDGSAVAVAVRDRDDRSVVGTMTPAGVDHDPAPLADGMAGTAGAPIVVEDRTWGMLCAASRALPLPAGVEERLAPFAELAAAAIGNAERRAELLASRARIVAGADDARRRLQRDVHEGAQQSLVHTVIALKMARTALADQEPAASLALVQDALGHAERATVELREIARGILPAALDRGGLAAGVDSLVGHVALPVAVDVLDERLPRAVETAAYFILAEALANVVQHAGARSASITALLSDGRLRLEVGDDGRGGADATRGSGLIGLADRVDAVGGTMSVVSPEGEGTTLSIVLPLADGDQP